MFPRVYNNFRVFGWTCDDLCHTEKPRLQLNKRGGKKQRLQNLNHTIEEPFAHNQEKKGKKKKKQAKKNLTEIQNTHRHDPAKKTTKKQKWNMTTERITAVSGRT